MKTLKMLRGKFHIERNFRLQVYLITLIFTFVNMLTFVQWKDMNSPWAVPALLISGIFTLGIYYITDSIRSFVKIVRTLSKIAKVFAQILGTLTAFTLGLGRIFGICMGYAGVAMVVMVGVVLAYILPIVFVPALSFISSKFLPDKSYASEYAQYVSDSVSQNGKAEAESGISWEKIYRNVIAEAKKDDTI